MEGSGQDANKRGDGSSSQVQAGREQAGKKDHIVLDAIYECYLVDLRNKVKSDIGGFFSTNF